MTQEKEYFAFISYKREDEKWAKWLAAAGISVPAGVPLEIDPVYALDAAELSARGLCLCK